MIRLSNTHFKHIQKLFTFINKLANYERETGMFKLWL